METTIRGYIGGCKGGYFGFVGLTRFVPGLLVVNPSGAAPCVHRTAALETHPKLVPLYIPGVPYLIRLKTR